MSAVVSALALCAVAALTVTSSGSGTLPFATEQCGGGIPVFASSKPILVGPTPQPINAGSLSEITDAAGRLGDERYPESFAGVAMDTETDRVTVWRRYSPDFDRELRALPGQEKIVIRCAEHSSRDLIALMELVFADREYWISQGLPVHRSGPRIDGTCVEIHSVDPPVWEAAFRAHYPNAPFCFMQSEGEGEFLPLPWVEPTPSG